MNDVRDTCEPDGAADRAARAARTLAAIAHDAARKHVKRDVVPSQADGRDAHVVTRTERADGQLASLMGVGSLDAAERLRQDRLRRWQALPYPNRKGG